MLCTADALMALGKRVFYFMPSSKQVVRNMWKQIDIWLHSSVLRLQLTLLIDFGDVFYMPEMAWSEKDQFQCAQLPARWVYRMELLANARQNPENFFQLTLETMTELSVSPESRRRIMADIDLFLLTAIDHYTPRADTWLSFPHIFFA